MRRREWWMGLLGASLAGCAVTDEDAPECADCGAAIDVPGPAEVLPAAGAGPWEIVRDEQFFVGWRGISPDPVPALALGPDGQAWVGFPTRIEDVLQVAYASRSSSGAWDVQGLGTPSYVAPVMLAGTAADEAPQLLAPRNDYAWVSDVWRLVDGPVLEETLDAYVFQAAGAEGPLLARDQAGTIVVLSRDEGGWESEALLDDPYVTSVAAALRPDGEVGLVYYDSAEGAYLLIDSTGAAEAIRAVAYPYYGARLLLAYDGAEPVVVLPDESANYLAAGFQVHRRSGRSWTFEPAVDSSIPPVTECPAARGQPCANEGTTFQAVGLVTTDVTEPVFLRITQAFVYERECLSWEPEPMGCALRCADAGGPQGEWAASPYAGVPSESAIVIGDQDVPVPGGAVLRATSLAVDSEGRIHLAATQWSEAGPEVGDDIRYLVLQRGR